MRVAESLGVLGALTMTTELQGKPEGEFVAPYVEDESDRRTAHHLQEQRDDQPAVPQEPQ